MGGFRPQHSMLGAQEEDKQRHHDGFRYHFHLHCWTASADRIIKSSPVSTASRRKRIPWAGDRYARKKSRCSAGRSMMAPVGARAFAAHQLRQLALGAIDEALAQRRLADAPRR